MENLCCFFTWIYLISFAYSQDPCSTTRYLTGKKRSVEYTLSSSDPDPCDRLIQEDWYRIEEKGTLPTRPGQRLTLNACQRGFLKCCDFSFPIEVQNCGDYNVFHLRSTPGCPGRYCTEGPPAPCEPGTASETGFKPCERLDITFSVTPVVEPFLPTDDPLSELNKLAFRCKTSMPSTYHGYVFDFAWFIDNEKLNWTAEKIPYNSLNTGNILHQKDWDPEAKAKIGFWIQCSIRARQSIASVPTPYNTSQPFFAGVKMSKHAFNVKAGEKVAIEIQSTVPIACKRVSQNRKFCEVRIEMFSFEDQFGSSPAHCNESLVDEDKRKPSTCGTMMDGEKWNSIHRMTLHTQSDQSTRSSYTCAVQLIASSSRDSLWSNYHLPEVTIHVSKEQRPEGYCYSVNDPHVRTFDGSSYTTHDVGEFVLFKHRTKPIEVNTIHKWSKTYQWAYNCGIAIRAAADVFVIYGCGDPVRWIIKRLNCDNEHQYLEIYERGKQYKVVLPTGTRLDIQIKSDIWLNIHVYMSPSDWNQTDGLCGTYNGNSGDDLSNREGRIVNAKSFVSSWMVPRSESLFVAKSRKEKLQTQVMYCSCFKDKQLDNDFSEADCGWKDSLPLCKPLNFQENKCRFGGRRDTNDELELDVPYDVVDFAAGPEEFSWKNGWTEEKAVNVCTSYASQSKLYQACSKLSGVLEKNDLKTCVADIKISGSDDFLSASLDNVKTNCLNELAVNTTFWKKKPEVKTTTVANRGTAVTGSTRMTTRLVTTPTTTTTILDIDVLSTLEEIADTVFKLDCPADCSNSGTCQDGICECNDGYTGEDCSVNIKVPPELYGLSTESLCDLSKRPCSSVSLFGNGFYDSSSLICQIVQAQLKGTNIIPGDFNMTVEGYLETFAELRCPLSDVVMIANRTSDLPVLDIFLIAVSFNAIDFSSQSPIVVYDANCTDCKVTEGALHCSDKKAICKIGSNCYDIRDEICHPKTDVSTPNAKTMMTTDRNTTVDGIKGRRVIDYVEIWKIGAAMGGLSIIIVPTLLILKR